MEGKKQQGRTGQTRRNMMMQIVCVRARETDQGEVLVVIVVVVGGVEVAEGREGVSADKLRIRARFVWQVGPGSAARSAPQICASRVQLLSSSTCSAKNNRAAERASGGRSQTGLRKNIARVTSEEKITYFDVTMNPNCW